MPQMGGVAVLQQIRMLKPDQPVIMLTGAGTPEKEQQAHAPANQKHTYDWKYWAQ
jgi:CheY-like chemotaxis protein